jgi:hypothetical protein
LDNHNGKQHLVIFMPSGRRSWVAPGTPVLDAARQMGVAIDNAAMAAGLTGSDAYIETYRWGEAQEREGSPAAVAAAVVAELDAQYEKIDWRKTAESLKQ